MKNEEKIKKLVSYLKPKQEYIDLHESLTVN